MAKELNSSHFQSALEAKSLYKKLCCLKELESNNPYCLYRALNLKSNLQT